MKSGQSKYDWIAIQEFYDNNHTYHDVMSEFGMCSATLSWAFKRGKFKGRKKGIYFKKRAKASIETRKKISEGRKAYLKLHPEKVPYRLNHSSKESWLEKTMDQALKDSKIIGYIREYQKELYSYDFAFLDVKLDIEVDGQTHEQEKVKLIDTERDRLALLDGWTVLRFTWQEIRYNLANCIEIIKAKLLELGYKLANDILEPKNIELCKIPEKKNNRCPTCNIIIHKKSKFCLKHYPRKRIFQVSKEELEKFLIDYPITKIGEMFGVTDNAIRRRCKCLGVIIPSHRKRPRKIKMAPLEIASNSQP